MGAGRNVLIKNFVFLAALFLGVSLISEARPRANQSSCSSGTCGTGTCSNGTCGQEQGVFCRNGTCNSVGPFQQGQFVSSPQQGTGTQQGVQQQQGTQTPAQAPQQTSSTATPAQSSTTAASNATSSAREGAKEMRVINSEPVDITQFAKKEGKDLTRVMLNPNTPLYVKMKSDKSDGGLFWTFLIDPATYKAYGKTPDGLREFNFNDPYERQSLAEVKSYLKGMQLDATLWGFLKQYWPNEDFGTKPGTAATTQVADSRPNPSDGTTHVGPQPQQGRPEAAPRQTASQPAREESSTAQARGTDRNRPLLGNLAGTRAPNTTKAEPPQPDSSSSSSGAGRVIVNIYKKSNSRKVCTPCDDLSDNSGKIKGQDELNWFVGGRNSYPSTEIIVEKNGKRYSYPAIGGNMVGLINSTIAEARAFANQ